MASIDVFPSAPTGPVSKYLYSGFLEHLGRCIYGGILPSTPTTFPYTPLRPCPQSEFTATPKELLTPQGFRGDVLRVLRDELQVPLVRWPGGNYVSSYHWEDGVGPVEERRSRPELAWGGEECNRFGTNEFIEWCREAKIEPFIILNMGTGTLAEALHWIEYCNGTGDTYYANLRRKHTGHDAPHNVHYWGLGNEVYGPWQVGQQSATAYSTTARQWAHAIKLLDPSVQLVACGETGPTEWDATVLDALADKVELHSIHMYTGFGDRDRGEGEKEFARCVYGPDAAEYAVETCAGLINKARLARNVTTPIKIAFDEYGPWDETIGTPQNGLEQTYTLTDALAMAAWLNVFVRHADVVHIACNAQSVNVISPLMTSPTGVLRQATFYPLALFSRYMRDGTSVRVEVNGSPTYDGETLPTWIGRVKGAPKELDVSAVLVTADSSSSSTTQPQQQDSSSSSTQQPNRKELRVAVVNRSETHAHTVPIRVAFAQVDTNADVEVHTVWHADVKAKNEWGREREVGDVVRKVRWPEDGRWTFVEHSFTLLVLPLL